MKFRKKYYLFLIALFSTTGFQAFGQSPEGYLRDFKLLENEDTLRVHRYYGDWWFGLFAGPNIDLFFGDLFSKENPNLGDNVSGNRQISFSSTFGGGFYFGGTGEYRPRNERWAYSLGLSFLDRKAFSALSAKMSDSLQTQYEYKSVLDYLIVSPSVKYYTQTSGLYYYSSIDVGIPIGSSTKQRKRFVNSGDIEYFLNIPGVKSNLRLEFNLGVGYEFLLADYNGIGRIVGNPYISLNAGSNVISHLNSSWNAIGFKVGFAMKFGKDHQEFDTISFDPTYEEPIYFVTQVAVEGIEFPGFAHSDPLPPVWIAMVEAPVIEEEIAAVPISDEVEFSGDLRERTQGLVRNRITPNQLNSFYFDKPETTSLSRELEQYLDQLADFLKSNPKYEVRITGHSDNQGSRPQNTDRALTRATNVQRYLIQQGIPEKRILSTGRGSLIPVALNDTPANQRKNRRVEIIVVPK